MEIKAESGKRKAENARANFFGHDLTMAQSQLKLVEVFYLSLSRNS
jgi:hypothetical protein